MKETPTIQTPRLLLREFKIEDAPDVYTWTGSLEVTKYLWWLPNRDLETTEKILSKWIRLKRNYSWAVCLEDHPIGEVQVIKDLPEKGFELGMTSAEAYWGHGYMKEAISHAIAYLFSHGIYDYGYAESDERNLASHYLLKALGFEECGRKENLPIEKKGEVINVICFRLSQEDFQKKFPLLLD